MQVRRENTCLIFSLESGPMVGLDVSTIELATVELAEKKLEEIAGALEQELEDAQDTERERVVDIYEQFDKIKEAAGLLGDYMEDWSDSSDPKKST